MKPYEMKNKRLKGWIRAIVVLCGLGIAVAVVVPIWRIELAAPQYPEGLVMKIFANKLGGDVAIVNGLNHYIGMKTLHENDFPEFTILPYILSFFAAFCLFAGLAGRRLWLLILTGLYLLFAVLAMVDFWKWEYAYGHNLSPDAPIQVPGMSYQPPLIGYKQLLNFGAYSVPDTGGWLMAAAGALLVVCSVISLRRRTTPIKTVPATTAAAAVSLLMLSSCSSGPEAIKLNVDNCYSCKMSISDSRFGAEVLSRKGRVWKFDDVHCLQSFLKEGELKKEDVREVYFVRFDNGHELLPSERVFLLYSDSLHTPMAGNIAAFASKADLELASAKVGGKETTWEAIAP